jgi:hypothetical protein
MARQRHYIIGTFVTSVETIDSSLENARTFTVWKQTRRTMSSIECCVAWCKVIVRSRDASPKLTLNREVVTVHVPGYFLHLNMRLCLENNHKQESSGANMNTVYVVR